MIGVYISSGRVDSTNKEDTNLANRTRAHILIDSQQQLTTRWNQSP